MSDKFQSKLFADVFVDRLVWAMRTDGEVIARGTCLTFEELAGLATRAGIFDVLIEDGFRSEEVRTAALRYGWSCVCAAPTREARLALYDQIRDALEVPALQSAPIK